MDKISGRQKAIAYLRQEWIALYLDPLRNSPANVRKRGAICDKLKLWRVR